MFGWHPATTAHTVPSAMVVSEMENPHPQEEDIVTITKVLQIAANIENIRPVSASQAHHHGGKRSSSAMIAWQLPRRRSKATNASPTATRAASSHLAAGWLLIGTAAEHIRFARQSRISLFCRRLS
jgi:hypothetical protein